MSADSAPVGSPGGRPRVVKPGPPQRLAALAALVLLFITLVLAIELAFGSLLMGLFLIVALAASLAAVPMPMKAAASR